MGKSSGWIYEGHAPLMAKRQGRRGEKRRRIVGGAVILALTIAVFAFARSSSGPDDEESLGRGDSPGDDDFDVPSRRFGAGGSHGAHAAVRPHRFNGDDAHGADAMHATHSAMDSMNSLSLGSAIGNHPVTSQRDRHREANRFHGATSGSSHHHGAIHDARLPMTRDDDGAHAHQAPPRIDFDHRPLVSHGGGWDAQPLIESRVRHRDCGVTPATLAAATAHDSPNAVRDLTSTDAARWFRRFWEPCVSCADEEQIGGERIVGANDGGSSSIESESDSETMGGRWVCDPERMIATPESDAEFKARVEAERKAQKHTWLESLSLFGGSKGVQREEPSHGSLPGEKVGCVVLTVGVNIGDSRGGFAFEKDMRRLYGCEVHVFDAAAGASGPSEDLGEDLSEDDGGMAFTAGVSLAATSTAPSRHNKMRHTISGGGLDAGSSSFDGTTDEDDDEEFRGETNDDEDSGSRSRNGRNLKIDSSFLSGGASYSKTERGGTQGTYAMTLSEMIEQATRGSMKGGSEGGHALVDVVRIACDGCEIEALTTPDSLHALKERVKQLLLEVRYTPGDVPVEAAPASVRGGGFHSGSFREREEEDDDDTEDEGSAEGSVSTRDYSAGNDPTNVATGTAGLWRKLQVDAGMLPFHKEVEIVDLSQEHHVGGADPLRRGVTTKKSVGFFGALFGAASRGGRRSSGDLGPVVEYGLINERMVRKTKGRAGTRDY